MMQPIKILLSFCFSMACFSAYAQKQYASLEAQAKQLSTYYDEIRARENRSQERLEYEQLFFEAFPTSFQALKTLKAPICFYLESLRCSDQAAYYDKYISIALEAAQEHDADGHSDYLSDYLKVCLYRKLFYNTEAVLSVLAKRSEAAIANFFRFVLDLPPLEEYYDHLSYNEFLAHRETYSRLRDRVVQAAPTIAQLPAVRALLDEYAKNEAHQPIKNTPVQAQAELLVEYYEKALNCTGAARAKYEQLFFDVYPASFAEMKAMYFGPLSGVQDNMDFFRILQYVDKDLYYNKYIDICIDGVFEADGISDGFFIGSILCNDPEKMTSLLAKRTDREVKSVFFFVFDEPHPNKKSTQAYYDRLYAKISKANPKVARLMQEAYEQVLSRSCCGH